MEHNALQFGLWAHRIPLSLLFDNSTVLTICRFSLLPGLIGVHKRQTTDYRGYTT